MYFSDNDIVDSENDIYLRKYLLISVNQSNLWINVFNLLTYALICVNQSNLWTYVLICVNLYLISGNYFSYLMIVITRLAKENRIDKAEMPNDSAAPKLEEFDFDLLGSTYTTSFCSR